MIINYISILFKLNSAHLRFLFKGASPDPKLYYSAVNLFSKQSFRLPQSAKKDVLIILKMYWRVVKKITTSRPEIHSLGSGDIAAFDSGFNAQNQRIQYLKHFGVNVDRFLSRENLVGSLNVIASLIHLFFVTILFAFVVPFSFSRRRVCYALLLREIVEWVNLLSIFKNQGIKKLYYFCIYEKDANFLTLILQENKIWVSKITSEAPLKFANKIIIADELCLCFAYQVEEVEAFKNTMFYERLQVWIPEMQITYLDKYKDRSFDIPINTIGFYSSAFWLRKKLNHSMADIPSYNVEENLLQHLVEYLKQHSHLKLVLFLHPYEKRNERDFKLAQEHYAKVFGEGLINRVEFVNNEFKSTEIFNKVNIGLSVFSTIMFERLSLGFKTILAPMDNTDFPLLSSPFRNVCVYTKEELFKTIDRNIPLSKEEFFETNGISSYISKGVILNYKLK